MFENADTNNSPSQNDEYDNNSSTDYLRRAAQASAAGDAVLGMHLYLAAFEQGTRGVYAPDDEAIDGLRQAWSLACKFKERSLAEYIFEKLEPFLAPAEVSACAEQLQRLALDKLEEFGLTREDLEDMTDMISQDFLGIEAPRLMKVEHVTLPGALGAGLALPSKAKTVTSNADGAGAEEKVPKDEAAPADTQILEPAAPDSSAEGTAAISRSDQAIEDGTDDADA
ncbi:MAG: ribonucleotide reductase subunit alpha, partial [Raoultibacter sp.]